MLRYTWSHVQIKQHVQIKSESLIFYRPFLPVQISTVCGSSTTINSTCWGTFDDLSLQFLKSLSSAFSADANRSCGRGHSLRRSFTSCSEAQVKPRGYPSLIWSSIRPISGQTTRTTLFGYSPSQMFFCSIAVMWRTRLKKTVTETGRHHCENILHFQ